jgi:carbamoyltransferase
MLILGLTHPISWNSAAVLLEDGKVIAAVEEERFVRVKHAPRMFPHHAIAYVLQRAGIKESDIDIVALGGDQGLHSKEEIDNAVKKARKPCTADTERDFWVQSAEAEALLIKYLERRFRRAKISFVRHHLAHAASTCFVSGFDKALFMTIDGRGEFESGLLGSYENGEMEVLRSIPVSDSLGAMYSLFTELIGFRPHTDEGKTMGLAAYGTPIEALMRVVETDADGRIQIDWDTLLALNGRIHFEQWFKNTLSEGDPTKDMRKDLAATAQTLMERSVLALLTQLVDVTGVRNLCLAGGCALNIDMNGAILNSGLVKDIFVQPASHDAGCALGAALYVHSQLSSKRPEVMRHAYLGPEVEQKETQDYLDNSGVSYRVLSDVPSEIANLISEGQIVGWVQGRAEFGPRALGSRSLLANPTIPDMCERVNRVKGREYWRPLAPSVTDEATAKFFSNTQATSPFMLLKFAVRDQCKAVIPAVVHVDGSARPQTVSRETNEVFWNLLSEFSKIQGVPVLINTSLNLKGEPIVNSIQDCLKTLYCSEIDCMCIDRYLITRHTFEM